MRTMTSRAAASTAATTLVVFALIVLQGSAMGQASGCDADGPEVPAEASTRCQPSGSQCSDSDCGNQDAAAEEKAGTSLATIDELVALGAPGAKNSSGQDSGAVFGYRIDLDHDPVGGGDHPL